MEFDAVVLAGGGREEWFAQEGVTNKSLLSIDGRPMVEFVLRALRGSRYLKHLILVSNFQIGEELKPLVDRVVPAGNTMEENIERGVMETSSPLVALMGSDIPLISPQTVDRVISLCESYPASLYLPVVRKEDIERVFPGSQRTYAHLKEGNVKAGNLFLFRRENWHTVENFLSRVVAGRKQIWKLASILGTKCLFKFLMGQLSIEELEKVVSQATSLPVKAIIIDAPDLGVDVDKLEDLILARAVLEK